MRLRGRAACRVLRTAWSYQALGVVGQGGPHDATVEKALPPQRHLAPVQPDFNGEVPVLQT
jgi:hypothetical protein